MENLNENLMKEGFYRDKFINDEMIFYCMGTLIDDIVLLIHYLLKCLEISISSHSDQQVMWWLYVLSITGNKMILRTCVEKDPKVCVCCVYDACKKRKGCFWYFCGLNVIGEAQKHTYVWPCDDIRQKLSLLVYEFLIKAGVWFLRTHNCRPCQATNKLEMISRASHMTTHAVYTHM